MKPDEHTDTDATYGMSAPAERPTPITDAAKAPFCPGRFFVFSEVSENLERQLAEANEKIQGLQDGIEYATAALMREKALADRLAGSFIALRNAEWLSSPGRAGDVVEDLITAWKETRNENAERVHPYQRDRQPDAEPTPEPEEALDNSAAGRGCHGVACSPSSIPRGGATSGMKVHITLRLGGSTGKAHYVIHPEAGQELPQWYLAHFRKLREEAACEIPQPSSPPILCIPWLLSDNPSLWLDVDLSRLARTGSSVAKFDTDHSLPAGEQNQKSHRCRWATSLIGWCRRSFERLRLSLGAYSGSFISSENGKLSHEEGGKEQL